MKFEGQQIILRDWSSEDVAAFGYWMKPGHKWIEFDGPYYPHLDEEEIPDSMANLQAAIDNAQWENPRSKMVIAIKDTNELLGTVSRYWISKETNWLAIGIGIWNPTYWGQGIGFEALGIWCDYLFAQMEDIVRLDIRTWSGNHGMMRLAEKLGFREEARFRDARIVKGDYFDGMGYGILRSEWDRLYPNGFIHFLQSFQVTRRIKVWDKTHARWPELMQLAVAVSQDRWMTIRFDWHLSSHMLVALQNDQVVGYLRLVRQEIGADMERPSVTFNAKPLIEAKVMAFAVAESHRNQGIGRLLQNAAISEAKRLGCYQLRSFSNGTKPANHHLKISMDFGIQPHVREDDDKGAFFVMPLK